MAKKSSPSKPAKPASRKSSKKTAPKRTAGAKPGKGVKPRTAAKARRGLAGADAASLEKAKELEALDAVDAAPKATKRTSEKVTKRAPKAATQAGAPFRNSDFPSTYIQLITVSLADPDHLLTLKWTGPQAASQETGSFRTSPGAGLKGLNCDNTATSRTNGSKCTPKGTFPVSGFAARLNSDARAVFVTWFVRARGIALHYFPSVPRFAASHGCVRIELKRIAQLIQSNSRVGLTKVTVDGTWTKPAKQY